MPNPSKLLDQVREKLRVKHYSIRTGQVYLDWIKRHMLFHDKRHPRDGGALLAHLAVTCKVAASPRNQTKPALLFLYREVLESQLPRRDNVTQAKAPKRFPVVLPVSETQAVRDAGAVKPATPHTLRHSFATHSLQSGYDIRRAQELPDHSDVSTMTICTYALNKGGRCAVNPPDNL